MTSLPNSPSWSLFAGTKPEEALRTEIIEGDGWWAAPTGSVKSFSPVGVSHLPKALQAAPPTLVVSDGDSTLYKEEVIDLLAERAGVGEKVAAITDAAMHGHLDFAESLTERVQTLRGLPVEALGEVRESLTLNPGVADFISWVHENGGKFGIVSGGFTQVLEPLASALGADHLAANSLEVVDGRLTGRVLGKIVDSHAKRDLLRKWVGDKPLATTVAVGDGANDIPMLREAGVGIAYCAKPAVKEAVPSYTDLPQWQAIIGLLGKSPAGS